MNEIDEMQCLIHAYLGKAKYCCELLRNNIPSDCSILRAKVLNLIPRKGIISDIEYSFHGVGCRFQFANDEAIEIDFGPQDRCDGFDSYKLRFFLESLNEKTPYKSIMDLTRFDLEFDELVKMNIIFNPKWHPSTHLYYMRH